MANSDTAVSKTVLAGATSRDWERGRDEVERVPTGRDEDDCEDVREREDAARGTDEARGVVDREEALEREDVERDVARELEERSVVECERVPRRVDSLELTVRLQLFSSSDQIRLEVIRSLQQHQHQLCPLLRQPRQQCLQECSQL